MHKIQRALISVSDKSGLEDLVKLLHKNSVEIISTGGTAKAIEAFGIPITPIESVTGKPEAFQGRMKSISFEVASALLFKREDEKDIADAKKLNISAIDLVVVNLYPFEDTYKSTKEISALVEKIDIGGPTMLRSAAKNFKHVAVLTNPEQYPSFLESLEKNNGASDLEMRKKLSVAAFQLSARYESAISKALEVEVLGEDSDFCTTRHYAEKSLRYGENPHQSAKLFVDPSAVQSLAAIESEQGKALSYNNYIDADAAWRSCSDVHNFLQKEGLQQSTISIIKHANPCGVASHVEQSKALELAWAGDPVSSFGSVICFSEEVNAKSAGFLKDKFVEVIIAPGFSVAAKEVFSAKKNLRLLEKATREIDKMEWMYKSIDGGLLVQEEDSYLDNEFQQVTKAEFSPEKLLLAKFSSCLAKHLKSNAISLARSMDQGFQMLGAGMGQPNRIDCIRRLAFPRSKEYFQKDIDYSSAVLASDAFFPFADSIEVCQELGINYILQPGGSIRDQEVIDACDQAGIAMLFTKRRHFRH